MSVVFKAGKRLQLTRRAGLVATHQPSVITTSPRQRCSSRKVRSAAPVDNSEHTRISDKDRPGYSHRALYYTET